MFFRVFVSVGLLALGYYVGREIGRGDPIRREMERLRDEDKRNAAIKPPRTSGDDSKG